MWQHADAPPAGSDEDDDEMSSGSGPSSDEAVPLVLDVDGSLLRTDLLLETFWAALGTNAGATVTTVARRIHSRAGLKRGLTEIAHPDIGTLPVEDEVIQLAREAAAEGRRVILTSGSDQTLIDALAERLGLPGPHFGSDGQTNLTGRTKAERLVAEFGSGRFDYVGNATVDLAIWREARRVISIAPSSSLARELDKLGKPVETVGRRWNAKSLLRGMRPHQWLKNLLLLLPLLAAHAFSLDHLVPVLLMIVAFSATASSVYLVNDLFDLATDRVHPEKRFRPIASGELPISVAMAAARRSP